MCHASCNPAPAKPLSPEEWEQVKSHPTPLDIPSLIATIELLHDTSLARDRTIMRYRKALRAVQMVSKVGMTYGEGIADYPKRTDILWDDDEYL